MKVGNINIRNVTKGSFRVRLYAEDVMYPDQVVEWETDTGEVEQIKVYKGIGFQISDVNVYFRSRLYGYTDKRLQDVVNRLCFINGFMNEFSIKKMVEFILNFLTHEGTSYEAMFIAVKGCLPRVDYSGIVPREVPVFYSRFSKLSKGEKRNITMQEYKGKIDELNGRVIHTVAQAALEGEHMFYRVGPKLISENIVPDKLVSRSENSVRKYMREDTKQLLEFENQERPFVSKKVLKKYREFLEDPGYTLDELAKRLGTSKGTVIKFRKLREIELKYEKSRGY